MKSGFVASSIRRELAFADANSPVLAGVVGSANHLAVLELIAANADVGTREAVRHLSLTLPSRMLSAFVDSQRIADDAKLAPVLEHIRKHKNFPPNCESLWSRPAAPGRQRPAAGIQGGLLPKILEQVSAAELVSLYEHVPLNGRIAYLTSLLVVCRNDDSKAPAFEKLIEAVDEDAFAHLIAIGIQHPLSASSGPSCTPRFRAVKMASAM